jgi:hypothetical protein
MSTQGEFSFDAGAAGEGYSRWLAGRKLAAVELARRLNLRLQPKAFIIDERLLAKRNSVAHGQFFDLGVPEFEDTFSEMCQLLEIWRNEIENACASRKYLTN